MKAIAIKKFGAPEVLQQMELPEPDYGTNDVLIKIRAAGVGAWDCFIRRGEWGVPGRGFPFIVGGECAGVVERIGANVTNLKEGDNVFCYARLATNGGCYAEYYAAHAENVTLMPNSINFDEAAAVPISGLTAHQAIEELQLKADETILITAAAGGTGVFAVQIAARMGARVIATASRRNHEFLRQLGAIEVIDYNETNFVEAVRAIYPSGVDIALDNVGEETLTGCFEAVRDGGRLAFAASPSLGLTFNSPRGIVSHPVYGKPDSKRLAILAQMLDDKLLSVPLDGVLPLAIAGETHKRIESGHVRGKLVLSL